MKFVAIVAVILSLGALIVLAAPENQWNNYKLKHGKTYSSRLEESRRQALFEQEVKRVAEHNAKGLSYRMGLNHMSDWTPEEKRTLMGFKQPKERQLKNSPQAEEFIKSLLARKDEVPAEVDWRKSEGVVTPVKNQKQCGSCWAFATTGVLEGQQRIRNMTFTSLSEQNLVDCSKENNGCNGGVMSIALSFVRTQHGIDDEKSYPYKGKDGKCQFNPDNAIMEYIIGGAILSPGDEELMKLAVAYYGPVSVGIAATKKLQAYEGGVFDDPNCGEDLNHGVLVVGYGTDKKSGTDYWIVKNSWSKDWGEHGYVRMARNKDNQCGISDQATIAI